MSGPSDESGADLYPEFRARLDAACNRESALIAVSGGSDSMALAALCARAAKDGAGDFIAATVDHGLRANSGEDAAEAGRRCESLGLPHTVLRWRGDKPSSHIQAAARGARYALLADWAAKHGRRAILTGHTADDQAETVLMRLSRGAGPRGLASMAEESRIAAGAGEPVALIRPLLRIRRDRLKSYCAEMALDWFDDPSNDDPKFERVRVRALLGALEEQDLLTTRALCETARRAWRDRERLDRDVRRAFDLAGGSFSPLGFAVLDRPEHAPADGDLAARLIYAANGAEHAPDEEAARAAFQAALRDGAACLGGALLKMARDRLFILREPGAILGRAGVAPIAPMALHTGERALWDGRFILERMAAGEGAAAALGVAGLESLGPRRALFACPDEALLVAPAPLVKGDQGFTVTSLAAERFSGAVRRFTLPGA